MMTLASLNGEPVEVLASLFLIQLPGVHLGEKVDDDASTWGLAAHRGDPDAVPGSLLQPGPALAGGGIWGLNQQVEDFSLSLPLSLSICLSSK